MTTGDRESALLCHFVMHFLAQILRHNFWDIERRLVGLHGTHTKKQPRLLLSLLTIHLCWWMNHLNCSNMWRDSLVCFINHQLTRTQETTTHKHYSVKRESQWSLYRHHRYVFLLTCDNATNSWQIIMQQTLLYNDNNFLFSQASLLQHVRREIYQSSLWSNSITPLTNKPSPEDYGRRKTANGWRPH